MSAVLVMLGVAVAAFLGTCAGILVAFLVVGREGKAVA